jgi:hypothetical protein
LKVAINVVVVMICGAVLYTGHQHWKEKVAAHKQNIEVLTAQAEDKLERDIRIYTKGLSPFLEATINKAHDTKQPIDLVIVESGSETAKGPGWAVRLKDNLEKTYGKEIFNVNVQSYKGMTTTDMIAQNLTGKLSSFQPDMLLFEVPMIQDNGIVGIQNTFRNLNALLDGMKKSNPNMVLMLMPPNPLYQAEVYPREVAGLQKFARTKDIYYLDHWKSWPDSNSPELLNYLEKDRRFPNEKGQELWAQIVTRTFVNEPIKETSISGGLTAR